MSVSKASSSAPVFAKDIAPILYRHCAGCHHPGEAAPFSLLTFDDAHTRARLIADVTRRRYMPPWKPISSEGQPHFLRERKLRDAEIETLQKWADSGAPEGDRSKAPAPPTFGDGWKLGTPDAVIELPAPFAVPADGPDLYQCFVVPMHMGRTRYVRAWEFRPSNRRVVHHAILFTDMSHIATAPSYPCFGSVGLLPTNALGGWSPGNVASEMLAGAAIPVEAGSRLIAQLHYHPDGKPEQERWRVGLYFTDAAPTRHVVDVGLASRQIDIAPGESHYVVRDHFTLPVDIWAVGIIPHAHYVCREMHGRAVLPGGRVIRLLDINDWDFNWQDQYRYREPILLPEDTRLEMEFVYDNSSGNPRNPHSPPQRVVWGPGVDDEMSGLHIQAIPVRAEDGPELGRALWGKVVRSLGGSLYRPPVQH